jgi:hypothetical protein
MENSDTLGTLLSWMQRLYETAYYVIPALIGLFMILWGIFFNGGDLILIGAGLFVFLLCGWYAVQTLFAKGA